MTDQRYGFYEFFAGGGMAELGLGEDWECLLANDISEKKAASYRQNMSSADRLIVQDVATLSLDQLPGRPSLAWASFPCQDLSLAGDWRGLDAERSGTFWPFWRLIEGMVKQGRAPRIVALENVVGAILANQGRDFTTILEGFSRAGYRFGPLVIDAVRFLPQSRPRLFIVGVRNDVEVPTQLLQDGPSQPWHSASLRSSYKSLAPPVQKSWLWWNVPIPENPKPRLADLIESEPSGVSWHSTEETTRLLEMMSPVNRRKVEVAARIGRRVVGTIYKRTRVDETGKKVQRAEVRFDGISGCLRTPAGGSSRQLIMVVTGGTVRTRLLSPREAARLMGVPDKYALPSNYNEAYHLMGDGLAVPVVGWLSKYILTPLAAAGQRANEEAA